METSESRTYTIDVSIHSFAVGLHIILDAWREKPNACVRTIRNLHGAPGEEPCVVYSKEFANPRCDINMHVTIACTRDQPKITSEVVISVRPVPMSQ